MIQIPLKNVRQYQIVSGVSIPLTVNYQCPKCNEIVSGIRQRETIYTGKNMDATIEIRCTACEEVTKMWIPEFNIVNEPTEINMYGVITKEKSLMQDIEALPKKLQDAYLETIDVFKAEKWAATSVMCRRTLEGVVYYLYDADKNNNRSLYNNLKDLPLKVDLADKIIQLADGIRKAGNFGAHFDENIVQTKEIATMLVEYIEYLLEFSFVLPKRAENLHNRIESLISGEND